jgi:UTP--glucose-1-phosphate uridylyltransferase
MWDDGGMTRSHAVEVAVIPCAGAGTRMLPATRAVPKPLLPVIDRPVLQYIVEEAVAAGITEVILVVDERPGDPVMAHFTGAPPIEGLEGITFVAVVQTEPAGLGDAVLRAADAVGDRPFLCMLSDRFPVPGREFSDRMVEVFDGRAVLALERVGEEGADSFGFVSVGGEVVDGLVTVDGAVEKPGRGRAPSDLALMGRYVLPASIFAELASLEPGHGGEIQLTDAIDSAARTDGAVGLVVDHVLLDIGMPAGLLEATAAVGLARPDMAPAFREAIRRLLGEV